MSTVLNVGTNFLQKDLEEAFRFLGERPYLGDVGQILSHHIERLKDALAFNRESTIFHFLFKLKHDLKLGGLANRLSTGNIKDMSTSLAISARTGYLLHIYHHSDDYDCLPIFELLDMLAVFDLAAVEEVTRKFHAPFEKGHRDTNLLCNAVYMALGKHPNPETVVESINRSKSTKFFQSIFGCLVAIVETDASAFLAFLNAILKGNRRQEFHSALEKAICIEAHAMVNLWSIRNPTVQLNISSLELPWDAEFHSLKPYNPEAGNLELAEISQVLANWIAYLPFDISSGELRFELKESAFKKLMRRFKVSQRKSKLNKSIVTDSEKDPRR